MQLHGGEVTIKNMEDSSQTHAPIEDIENYIGVDYEYKRPSM